jgi:DnaJ-class molecular chaperone
MAREDDKPTCKTCGSERVPQKRQRSKGEGVIWVLGCPKCKGGDKAAPSRTPEPSPSPKPDGDKGHWLDGII